MNNTINIGSVVKPIRKSAPLFSSLHDTENTKSLGQGEKALVLEVFRRQSHPMMVIHEFRVLTSKGIMGWVMSQDVELVK